MVISRLLRPTLRSSRRHIPSISESATTKPNAKNGLDAAITASSPFCLGYFPSSLSYSSRRRNRGTTCLYFAHPRFIGEFSDTACAYLLESRPIGAFSDTACAYLLESRPIGTFSDTACAYCSNPISVRAANQHMQQNGLERDHRVQPICVS